VKRLYIAISHHGLGHLAQTAPVLNALHERDPSTEFLIRTALPRATLELRLAMPFAQTSAPSDCNLVMRDAIRADVPASLAAYRTFHQDWRQKVEAEARRLEGLRVDAVFSNVGYLPLAAAQRAGIPSAAMCSLNWADIFRHYLGREPEAGVILGQMLQAYGQARAFLRPEPSMPMADLGNVVSIPPIVQAGRNRRAELAAKLGLAAGDRLVLVGMGGIAYRPPVERWPRLPGVVYIVPDDWAAEHPAIRALHETGMVFRDVLASADAVITKPGYGTYAEAAAAGVPVLTIPRVDWPETVYLNRWLQDNARALEISESALLEGGLAEPLARLWGMPARPVPAAAGALEASECLKLLLNG
jgi:hypothetical protein